MSMFRRGITLIELLVAMFVAGIVAYLAFDLIRGEQTHYSHVRTKVRLQEDGREAIRIIEEDLLNVGYTTGLTNSTSAINATYNNCTNIDGTNRIKALNSSTSSDSLVVSFNSVSTATGVTCNTTPNVVSYYVRASDSTLMRKFIQTTSGTPSTVTSAILNHVVTFQVQMGVDLATSASAPQDAQDTFWTHADTNISSWSTGLTKAKTPITNRTSDSGLALTGWTSGPAFTTITNIPRALAAGSTYRVGLYVVPNDSFRAMFDTTSTSYMTLFLSSSASGTPVIASTNLRLPALSLPTWVDWQFQTTTNYANAYIGFKALLSKPNTTGPSLSLAALRMRRVRNAANTSGSSTFPYAWANPDSINLSQRRATIAAKVWILAKSAHANKEGVQSAFTNIGDWGGGSFTPLDKNSYVVYERVIPVGNYGY